MSVQDRQTRSNRPGPVLLEDDFPRDSRILSLLKLTDTHFCNCAERYHALGRAIDRIERQVESSTDLYLARLRTQRLALLDEIAAMLETAEERFADRVEGAARAAAGDEAVDEAEAEAGNEATANSTHLTTPAPPAGRLVFGSPARRALGQTVRQPANDVLAEEPA